MSTTGGRTGGGRPAPPMGFRGKPDRPGSASDWEVAIGGHVSGTLTVAALRALPQASVVTEITCLDHPHHETRPWSGPRLTDVVASLAGDGLPPFVTVAAGDFSVALPAASLSEREAILALDLGGEPLGHDDGGPVRLISRRGACYEQVRWVTGLYLDDDASRATAPGIVEQRRGSLP